MNNDYKTVKNRAVHEFVERKSRFITTVIPANTESDALALIEQLRSKYYDASHNVYAYVIKENNICRYSDDGEPSGTAGIPVLEIIKKENLTNVCVVVTRYFGGILLGAGGLVRAYAHGAKEGIKQAVICEKILADTVRIKCDYTLLGKIRYETEQRGFHIRDIEYSDTVNIYVSTKKSETDAYIKAITEATNAKCDISIIGEEYIDVCVPESE